MIIIILIFYCYYDRFFNFIPNYFYLVIQNELILKLTNKHIAKFIIDKSNEESKKIIETRLAEQVIKQQLIGLTIGLFTSEEFEFYLLNQSSINKRIGQLIIQRVCSQIL